MIAPLEPSQSGPAKSPGAASGITYERLKQTHPRLDLNRVKILKALYKGGKHLLSDQQILAEVFPKYTHEKDAVYQERIKRAFYENVFAMVINQISAGLAQDPIHIHVETETVQKSSEDEAKKLLADAEKELTDTLGPEEEDVDEEADTGEFEAEEEPDPEDEEEDAEVEPEEEDPTDIPVTADVVKEIEVDPYWTELMENATALSDDGSNYRSFDQVMRDQVVEALVTGWAWTQADLPREDELPLPTSYKEQEESGGLRAYVVPWATECVTDWGEKNGRMLWVRTYTCEIPAEDYTRPRDTKVHCWTIWTATNYYRYVWEERKDHPLPNDKDTVPLVESGSHSFGRVPWTRLDVCATNGGAHLHVGDIIESLCRQYFNRQNSEAFQWSQFNYQQLYEFLGPEVAGIDTMVSDAQTDTERAKRTRSPGQVHVRGADDRAEFIGPDMAGANVGREAMQDLRDAILRVVAQMALAQDTSGAMLRRSADSKRQDSVAQEIVLGAIGKKAVTMANNVAELLANGRQDTEPPPKLVGYETFNVADSESIINMNVLVEGIHIPSATYQIERKYAMAVNHLGDNVSAETKVKIKTELMQSITQDQVSAPPVQPGGFGEKPFDDGSGDGEQPFDKGEDQDNPDDEIPPKDKGLPKSKKGNPLFEKKDK